MNRFALLLILICPPLATLAAQLDNPVLAKGEQVYQLTCATGYCHGIDGEPAGAPRLSARGFNALYIGDVTANGIAETPMAGFSSVLSPEDLNAVMSYIADLNGLVNPVFSINDPLNNLGVVVIDPRQSILTGDPALGRELFFDAYLKGVNRCSSCHELEGKGISVATPIMTVPASVAVMRALQTPSVKTVRLNNEESPVLVVSKGAMSTQLYDLSAALPVLRTINSDVPLMIEDGSQWQHADHIQAYTDDELGLVLQFLGAIQD